MSGFLLLPATAIATTVVLLVLVTREAAAGDASTGAGSSAFRCQSSRADLTSGMATAVIIGTTTLNYTFVGVSILFALLMRGGVLILAPVVDALLGRRVVPAPGSHSALLRRAGDRLRGGGCATR